jgi:hypothetical protein
MLKGTDYLLARARRADGGACRHDGHVASLLRDIAKHHRNDNLTMRDETLRTLSNLALDYTWSDEAKKYQPRFTDAQAVEAALAFAREQ